MTEYMEVWQKRVLFGGSRKYNIRISNGQIVQRSNFISAISYTSYNTTVLFNSVREFEKEPEELMFNIGLTKQHRTHSGLTGVTS